MTINLIFHHILFLATSILDSHNKGILNQCQQRFAIVCMDFALPKFIKQIIVHISIALTIMDPDLWRHIVVFRDLDTTEYLGVFSGHEGSKEILVEVEDDTINQEIRK
jgi:hypothetical protein